MAVHAIWGKVVPSAVVMRPTRALAALGLLATCVACTAGGSDSHARDLTSVTWRAAEPGAFVVFTDDSARIFDGCDGALRLARIGDGVLFIGKQVGIGAGCSPVSTWPPPAIAKFDQVLGRHHFTWHRTGSRLRLIDAQGETLDLHAGGPALSPSSVHWTLKQFNRLHGGTQLAPARDAHLVINKGSVHADDLCADVSGSAAVTDTTITFSNMRWSPHPCTDPLSSSLTGVMHSVLSGKISYSFFGDHLVLYGRGSELLAYSPGS